MRVALVLMLALCCGPVQAKSKHKLPKSPMSELDTALIDSCSARTDARMESMTLGKLDQIRNYEFTLRLTIAQLADNGACLTSNERRRVDENLERARLRYATACEVSVPASG